MDLRPGTIACGSCAREFPRFGQIPILLSEPQTYLSLCRQQCANLERQIAQSETLIERQLTGGDVLPLTKARCRAVVSAARGQVADVMAILQPLLGDASDARPPNADDNLPSLLTNVHYLFRDWGWPPEPDGENERALAAIDEVLEGEPAGRTLILGAGACRLPYDLARRGTTAETVVIDIDPLLFAAAHAVIRGGTVPLREGYAEVNELGNVEKRWQLRALDGSLSEERFHFLIADALEPPFESAVFDTVITPWFVDVIPADVRDVISTAHRLLKPSGRWLNAGPLRYTPQVPVTRRFTREELFALAERAGFGVGPWTAGSTRSLVSKHTGRGKIEWVMTVAFRKLDAVQSMSDAPPPWLLFRHLPVPTFAGQSLVWNRDPLAQTVISSIDGQRTLDDIAQLVAIQMRESNHSRSQIREAVRQCLAEVHPASHL